MLMNYDIVVKTNLSEADKERLYKAISFLCDLEDMLYETGVAEESAKQITKTLEILYELEMTGYIED